MGLVRLTNPGLPDRTKNIQKYCILAPVARGVEWKQLAVPVSKGGRVGQRERKWEMSIYPKYPDMTLE